MAVIASLPLVSYFGGKKFEATKLVRQRSWKQLSLFDK